jgi:rod shape determining protein RodA
MLRVDRGLVQNFDWRVFGLVALLLAMGLLNLSSATVTEAGSPSPVMRRQLVALAVGAVVFVVAVVVDYRRLERFAPIFYLGSLVLLAATLAFGQEVGGNRSWLVYGPLRLQPAELSKVAMVIVLSRYFHRHPPSEIVRLRDLAMPGLFVAIPVAVIVMQRDMGVALLTLLVGCTFLPFTRIPFRAWLGVAASGAAVLAAVWFFGLEPYQKDRILDVVNPSRDPLASGYQANQSRIAVGSGGLIGRGFRQGTQTQLRFLPTQHTDFVFSVLAEEWGLVGGLTVLVLYATLLVWGLLVARGSREFFGALLAVGIVGTLFWPAVINIAMVLGLAPVIGVPLPFFSYGGSAMVAVLLSLGVLLNVSMRRYMF